MFNWGIRERVIERTPFKLGTEPVIRLERETPRNRRFASDEDEERLLNACSPYMRAYVTTMLDTCCRPGELLSLQWKDVDRDRREMTVQASKAKTREGRTLPLSSRVHDLLEMRRVGPDGQDFGPQAYVFGDEIGNRPSFHSEGMGRNTSGRPARRSAPSRPAARGGVEVRGIGSAHNLREQVPRPQQSRHDDEILECDPTRASSGR